MDLAAWPQNPLKAMDFTSDPPVPGEMQQAKFQVVDRMDEVAVDSQI